MAFHSNDMSFNDIYKINNKEFTDLAKMVKGFYNNQKLVNTKPLLGKGGELAHIYIYDGISVLQGHQPLSEMLKKAVLFKFEIVADKNSEIIKDLNNALQILKNQLIMLKRMSGKIDEIEKKTIEYDTINKKINDMMELKKTEKTPKILNEQAKKVLKILSVGDTKAKVLYKYIKDEIIPVEKIEQQKSFEKREGFHTHAQEQSQVQDWRKPDKSYVPPSIRESRDSKKQSGFVPQSKQKFTQDSGFKPRFQHDQTSYDKTSYDKTSHDKTPYDRVSRDRASGFMPQNKSKFTEDEDGFKTRITHSHVAHERTSKFIPNEKSSIKSSDFPSIITSSKTEIKKIGVWENPLSTDVLVSPIDIIKDETVKYREVNSDDENHEDEDEEDEYQYTKKVIFQNKKIIDKDGWTTVETVSSKKIGYVNSDSSHDELSEESPGEFEQVEPDNLHKYDEEYTYDETAYGETAYGELEYDESEYDESAAYGVPRW